MDQQSTDSDMAQQQQQVLIDSLITEATILLNQAAGQIRCSGLSTDKECQELKTGIIALYNTLGLGITDQERQQLSTTSCAISSDTIRQD